MDKNRIEGRHGTSRWHKQATNRSAVDLKNSSGLVTVEVNAAVVQGSIVPLPGEISPPRGGEKSAEAIVVERTSRSAKERVKVAGGLSSMKGRTEQCPNRGKDAPADNAGRRGMDESLSDGKHVGIERGLRPARGRNRPVRTRTLGGVGPVAGSR